MKYRNEIGKIMLPDGGWIENPCYVDYGQGLGEQLCGGNYFTKEGKYNGHADEPGPMGTPGVPGDTGITPCCGANVHYCGQHPEKGTLFCCQKCNLEYKSSELLTQDEYKNTKRTKLIDEMLT